MLRKIIQILTTDKDVETQLEQTLNLEKLYHMKLEELEAEINDVRKDKTLVENVKEYVIGFMRLSLPVLESKEMEEIARRYNENCLPHSGLETFLYDHYIKNKEKQNPYIRQLAIETLARCATHGGGMSMHYFGKYVVAENELNDAWKTSALVKDLLIAIIILNAINVDYFSDKSKGEMKDLADIYRNGQAGFVKDDKESWYWNKLYLTAGKAHFDCTHNLEASLLHWLISNEKEVASLVTRAKYNNENKKNLCAAQLYYRAAEQISDIGKKQIYYNLAFQAIENTDRISSLRIMAEILHALRTMLAQQKTKQFDNPADIQNAQRILPLYTGLKRIFDAKIAPYQATIMKAVAQEAQRTHDLRKDLLTKPEKRPAPAVVLPERKVSVVTFGQFKTAQDIEKEEKPHESTQALNVLDSLAEIVRQTKYKA
ncbi:MAG: hypothetical protein ACYCQI_00225 [Gammaproteobacteria bacterium]